MRRSIATPCPVVASPFYNVEDSYSEDTTTNLDYTTAFQASFRNVRPKRAPPTRNGIVDFTIHEDEVVTDVQPVETGRKRPSRLLQPAKRVLPPSKALSAPYTTCSTSERPYGIEGSYNVKPQTATVAPKRLPAGSTPIQDVAREQKKEQERLIKQEENRTSRRRTLYLPSEDTTQPTMWMGIFSPVKNDILHPASEKRVEQADLTGIAAQMAEKRKRRTSTIQTQARRGPLQQNAIAQDKVYAGADRAGAPTGKENVPPGHSRLVHQAKEQEITIIKKKKNLSIDRDLQRKNFLSQARLENLSQPKHTSPRSSADVLTLYEVGRTGADMEQTRSPRVAWNAGPRAVVKKERPTIKEPVSTVRPVIESDEHMAVQPKVPTRLVQPVLHNLPHFYPQIPIVEHIDQPDLYEDDWLGQQETVIKLLLNSLFEQSECKQPFNTGSLRQDLLGRYNSPGIHLTYKRLQAALLYGSLSLSHESMFLVQGLANDVGRKKDFIKFWLDNYDNDLLRVALEIVTGKQVSLQTIRRSSGSSPRSTSTSIRKSVAAFIEAFLLRHEDAGFKHGTGVASDLGSKTILKSLMLVKALDLLKENASLSKCLFRRSATFKSSTLAVQTLMTMLNPAVGDPIRALRQLGYEVFHEQEPLQEVTYRVDNLATDLRDGVILTRLVELLLYKSASRQLDRSCDSDTNTICMPEGETLTIGAQNCWPLSQHLKLPCISRAAKIWNVRLTLAALSHVNSISKAIENITAEDIVDGYREKTVKLLWTLVGRYGLTGFVDRCDIRQEIRRLNHGTAASLSQKDELDESHAPQVECEYLIKEWSKAVAASKGHTVRNFTTSFSDGKVFEAILDEYEPYLLDGASRKRLPLSERLSRLGCNKQLSDLFSTSNGQVHIFSKDFVLAALAFLCSRVVSRSKLCRKAITIQRCWRKHWQTTQIKRRAIKRDLAHACAASVNIGLCLEEGYTNGDPVNRTSEEYAKTEIEDDIWLSL